MIQIAATSPSLHIMYISYNKLGEYGPATAKALATSKVIHTVNISLVI